MSDEIVRRLRNRSKESLMYLKESMPVKGIKEADEDEEIKGEEELDTPTEAPEEDIPDTEEEVPAEDSEGDEESEEEEPKAEEEEREEYANPLDNMYAVKYTIGQEVALTYSNGSNSKVHGTIDGYDTEGFYRIKWYNGKTTNGLTDIALADLVEKVKENKCVCGCKDLVVEGKYLVCDRCGRKIRESADPLTKADKDRPSEKKLIRSEAHPISTTIQDSIRNAFKMKKVNEEVESPFFDILIKELDGNFWTRMSELKSDIEELGYEVDELNAEYVLVYGEDEDGEGHTLKIPMGGTSRTMTLDFDRAVQL